MQIPRKTKQNSDEHKTADEKPKRNNLFLKSVQSTRGKICPLIIMGWISFHTHAVLSLLNGSTPTATVITYKYTVISRRGSRLF